HLIGAGRERLAVCLDALGDVHRPERDLTFWRRHRRTGGRLWLRRRMAALVHGLVFRLREGGADGERAHQSPHENHSLHAGLQKKRRTSTLIIPVMSKRSATLIHGWAG